MVTLVEKGIIPQENTAKRGAFLFSLRFNLLFLDLYFKTEPVTLFGAFFLESHF
jgi:hypothetical protein